MPGFMSVVLSQTNVVAVDNADTLYKSEVPLFTGRAVIVDCYWCILRLQGRAVSFLHSRISLFIHLVTLFFHVYIALLLRGHLF